MSLSCSCNEWEGDPGTWAFYVPKDFINFEGKKRKRCASCKELISIGSSCLKFDRIRSPYTEIELNIMGEEIPMPPLHICEKCGEIFLNLSEAGFCLAPNENMKEALAEYWEITGFRPGNAGSKEAE